MIDERDILLHLPYIENIGNRRRARHKTEQTRRGHTIISSLENIMTYKFDPATDVADLTGKVAIVTGGK